MPLTQTPSITSIVGNVVAPVGLITMTAILLSGYTGKYSGISDQMRRMTGEFRSSETPTARRQSLRRQLGLFHRRITAMWAASTLLSLALLAFIATVLAVLFSVRTMRLGPIGITTLIVGLVFVAVAVGLELYEISLARLTVAGELADVFEEG